MTKQTQNEPKFTPAPWRVERREFDFCGNMANAALISAAPEMYALLERVIREGGTRLDIADAILKLLAKARGEDKNG